MIPAPGQDADGPLRLVIESDGRACTHEVIAVTIDKAINRVPSAEIVLRDGDMPSGTFPVSDSGDYAPGKEITLSAGYGDSAEPLFKGIVVGQRFRIDADSLGTLTVECRDKAAAMTVGRNSANYVDKLDSEIAATLIRKAGLTGKCASSTITWKELVQFHCTDWDFMLSRAEAIGFVVIVDAGVVSFRAPDVSSDPVLEVTFGQNLFDFEGSLEARDQFADVSATAWDIAQLASVNAKVGKVPLNQQGDITAAALAQVLKIGTFKLQTPTPLDAEALKTWAQAQQLKSGLSRLRGKLSFQGSAKAKVGSLIRLAGVGGRFAGDLYVSAVRHALRDGNWVTRVEFGLNPVWYTENRDLQAPAASGLLPGIGGLHLGVVKKLADDPAKQYKVQVSIPAMQADADGVWARVMQFHATAGQGAFFIPEIGDEVVLGYFNDDPTAPVILGSLYGSKRQPAYPISDDNFKKAISTRTGLRLEYDDEKKVITLLTPANNKIVISDDAKSILLADQNGNTVTLGTDGIALDSPKDISLTARGKITLTATANVEIKATQDTTVEGLNISQTAKVGFSAKANATAELSASGQTTVKGALVMIN